MGSENIPLKSDVLIVNGEKDISNMIASMLQARGYAVHISCNLDYSFCRNGALYAKIYFIGYSNGRISWK